MSLQPHVVQTAADLLAQTLSHVSRSRVSRSGLDYCNTAFVGLLEDSTTASLNVAAARILVHFHPLDHISSGLAQLHFRVTRQRHSLMFHVSIECCCCSACIIAPPPRSLLCNVKTVQVDFPCQYQSGVRISQKSHSYQPHVLGATH
jgi:hypothetical protein